MMTIRTREDLREQRKNERLEQWDKLFTDHVYMVLNRINPGMKLGSDAVQFISKILILVLHEFVEELPESVTAVQTIIKKLFPSTWGTFVVKSTDTEFKANTDRSWLRRREPKSKEAKCVALLMSKLKDILKGNLDDRVVYYIYSILDEIINDILKWTSISVNKFQSERPVIDKRVLIAAIHTDRGLSELLEKLLPTAANDYSAIEYYQQTTSSANAAALPKTGRQPLYDYDKICQKFEVDENSYLRDLSLLVNVFKRRLEKGLGDDAAGRHYISSIFGNITEIYELTFRLVRSIEEVREMSQTQSMGIGLSEFAEGCEFDSYIRFMEIFKEPIEEKMNALLRDRRYCTFFDEEDKISFTPDGHCMRMAFKYVLPLYLHSVAAHFDGYYHYVSLLIKASRPGADRVELQNLETHLKSVATAINALELPPNPYKKYNRLKDDVQRAQHMSTIQRIQRSIEGWEGKVIGFMCTEFIREGDLNMFHRIHSMKDTIRGKSWSQRHVFLFDHLLVITKQLKSGTYKYKQQIKVQCCDIFDLPDDDDLKYAFRVRVDNSEKPTENIDIILFASSAEEKHNWLTSLVEMQTAAVLQRLLFLYDREMDARAPLVCPTPEQYRFAEPDTDDNINFEDYMRNSGIPVIKNGTLIKLVERLTYPAYSDNDYLKTFLTTYRTFCTPNDLLSLLIERFNIPLPLRFAYFENVQSPPPISRPGGPLAGRYDTVQSHGLITTTTTNDEQAFMRFRREYQKPIQTKVFLVLNHWIKHHFYDFAQDLALLQRLRQFLQGKNSRIKLRNDHLKTCKMLLDAISKQETTEKELESSAALTLIKEQASEGTETPNGKKKTGRTINVTNFPETLWHYAKKGDSENYDLLTLHPVEIGKQITLLHFQMYSNIKPVEIASKNLKKEKYCSPALKKWITHNNNLTFWLVKSILETECIDERVEIFSRILEIMVVLEQLNNFNGMVAFGAALCSVSINRLKASKSRLDKEKQQYYEHFRKVCMDDNRQTAIRAKMRSVNPPCVPFPGTYLTKMFFVEEQNKTFVKDREKEVHSEGEKDSPDITKSKRLISFVRCRKVAEIIKELYLYQSQQYMLRAEPSILQFFENLNPLNGFKDDNEFSDFHYNLSQKLEPKDGEPYQGKPKYPLEALKSPGIKVHHAKTPSTPKSAPSAIKSPKSPSALLDSSRQHSPDDSHFGIIDINPGHLPKYIGDSGRINPAFSGDTPLQTPTGLIRRTPSGRRPPASPLSTASYPESNHFSFPPQLKFPTSHSNHSMGSGSSGVFPTSMAPGAIVLDKPPAGRGIHKPPPPLPPTGTMTRKKPPPPPPCEPSSSKLPSDISASASAPEIPPRENSTTSSLPSPINCELEIYSLTPSSSSTTAASTSGGLAASSSSTTPPKSPSVSLSVPLPKRKTSTEPSSPSSPIDDGLTIAASCPPRPPKPDRLASRASSLAPSLAPSPSSSPPPAPPLPPKTYKKNFGAS